MTDESLQQQTTSFDIIGSELSLFAVSFVVATIFLQVFGLTAFRFAALLRAAATPRACTSPEHEFPHFPKQSMNHSTVFSRRNSHNVLCRSTRHPYPLCLFSPSLTSTQSCRIYILHRTTSPKASEVALSVIHSRATKPPPPLPPGTCCSPQHRRLSRLPQIVF